MMSPLTKRTIRYFTMPEILPRLKRIFGTGFSFLSFYMASVLNVARLLPDNHPYLSPANFGHFGIHHVMAQAWRNLVFKKENTDQIIIFFCLVFGIILLLLQVMLFILAFVMPTALAAVPGFSDFFVTRNPQEDLAFIFLDMVFGIPNLFNSDITTQGNWPTPFHAGLHEIFSYYNTGLAIVAFLLIIYFGITVTAETAYTGVPFGKRFNHAMVPIRLILALALLVPINSGMNGAQMITLYMAKWGSSMATNGWILFNSKVKSEILGSPDKLVVTPNPPDITNLLEFIFVAQTCRAAYDLSTENEVVPANRKVIRPYVIFPNHEFAVLGDAGATDLNTILASTKNSNITIRFGHQNPDWFPEYASYVKPYCGEIQINLQDLKEPGAYYVQNGYLFDLILAMWKDTSIYNPSDNPSARSGYAYNIVVNRLSMVRGRDPTLGKPTPQFIQQTISTYNGRVKNIIDQGVLEQINKGNWNEEFTKYGWGGAAIWYNKIAQFNGGLIASVYNLPKAKEYPEIMETVLSRKKGQDQAVAGMKRYNPVLADGIKIFPTGQDAEFAEVFYEAQTYWFPAQDRDGTTFLQNAINMLFGLEGLINIQKNVNIHPLAQLVGIGRGLIESAIQNFGYTGIGWFISFFAKDTGTSLEIVSRNAMTFFKSIAMIGLSIGFILFYVLPLLPFLYFFIAMTNWVKSIFEAMVGLPLWALAHIRIDGKGIPGPGAMNGYYLIFEVFINPILIVFGMLAGISIFSAQVVVLNQIWGLVTTNVTGVDVNQVSKTVEDQIYSIRYIRGEFDKFFFTAMYAVFVYLMGLSSFKLVDAIPDTILRWLGTSVKTFNETAEGMAGQMVSQSYQASQTAAGDISGVIDQSMVSNKK